MTRAASEPQAGSPLAHSQFASMIAASTSAGGPGARLAGRLDGPLPCAEWLCTAAHGEQRTVRIPAAASNPYLDDVCDQCSWR